MADADVLLEGARRQLPGCLALGISSLSAGTLLRAAAQDNEAQRALVRAARASADLFEGSRVVSPGSLCKRDGADAPNAAFEILIVEAAHEAQFLFRCALDRTFVAILRSDVDTASIVRRAKSLLPSLAPKLS